MQIELKKITIRDLTESYQDNEEDGVIGYGGKLDIRPPYQREFVYKDKQRDAVIDSINRDFPLNVMYWAVKDDGDFKIIDGQQSTISICQYVHNRFSFNKRKFNNLRDDEQKKILDYKLMVYFCSGTDSEKLEWLKTINIAGATLTEQELRNAVYSGSWVTAAKRYFSKKQCPAQRMGGRYLTGEANRQIYLETAIKWLSNGKIEDYMSEHQHEPDAEELWSYFQKVIDWVTAVFPAYRGKLMKGLAWGEFYHEYKEIKLDPKKLEEKISKLIDDDHVTSKSGIYEYVLTGEERHLNIRAFSDSQKQVSYKRQKGICVKCSEKFEFDEMEADHITPWHAGGKTAPENCQMLCKDCNRRKSGK